MSRDVIWTNAARRDLIGIRAYVGTFNPHAAERLADRLVQLGNSLTTQAERGRSKGTGRELLSLYPYIIRYRIAGEMVPILRVRHGARIG